MTEPIYDQLRGDARIIAERIWHPRHGYHQHQQQLPRGDPMGAMTVTELKSAVADLSHAAETIDAPAVDRLGALAGNPVADALLGALHVPAPALSVAADLLKTLGAAYPKPDVADVPVGDDGPHGQLETGVAQ